MRTFITFLSALLFSTALSAQTVATFDSLGLTKLDTFYVNYSDPKADVGFDNGLAYFPCYYDTSWGGLWDSGIVYSTMRDSTTSGYLNKYAARPYTGVDSSFGYAVVWEKSNKVRLTGAAIGKPVKGFYATNSTYTYLAIRDSYFNAKAFDSGDWFKLEIRGYLNGQLKADSVDFYLADYRDADSSKHYIVGDWRWVDLQSLGAVDSLLFTLSSTDTAGGFGMNTPAFFCMDNFTTFENVSVKNVPAQFAAKVYPNPAINTLYVEVADKAISHARVIDMSGRIVGEYTVLGSRVEINTSAFVPGIYTLQLSAGHQIATTRFVKQ